MVTGNRISDDPTIRAIHDSVKTVVKNQEKLQERLMDPETGYFKKVGDLEIWRHETIDPERKRFKAWVSKLIWLILAALLVGGSVFGLKLSFEPSDKQQVEQSK